MTNEEAIEILKDCELNPCVPKDKEAVNIAIKALEFQKKVKETCDYPYVVMETKYCYICSLVRRFDNEQETNTN